MCQKIISEFQKSFPFYATDLFLANTSKHFYES